MAVLVGMMKLPLSQRSVFIIGCLTASLVYGSDEWGEWVESDVSPWRSSGFIEASLGGRLQENPVKSQSATLGEAVIRTELDYLSDEWEVRSKWDIHSDAVAQSTKLNIRQLRISGTLIDRLDVKVGRQSLSWGTGDYLFVNDLFPKDWVSFFSGREDEYLKVPFDSIKASWYADHFTVDWVWIPSFTPDEALTGERFSFFSPASGQLVAPSSLSTQKPSGSTQVFRLSTYSSGIEYALYGYLGYWTTPLMNQQTGHLSYPEFNSLGGSVRGSLGKGVANAEFAWYDSREDRQGTDPSIPNSQFRGLLGYERSLKNEVTLGFQYSLEWVQHYDQLLAHSESAEFEPDRFRHLLTARWQMASFQQTLHWTLFMFWSPSDRDSYLRPQIRWRKDDHWTFSGGVNLFYGSQVHTPFGQHEANSSLWLSTRYYW